METLIEATTLYRFANLYFILALGIITARKHGSINSKQAEQLLFTPENLVYLEHIPELSPACLKIQRMGLEIKTAEDISPAKLNEYLQELQILLLNHLADYLEICDNTLFLFYPNVSPKTKRNRERFLARQYTHTRTIIQSNCKKDYEYMYLILALGAITARQYEKISTDQAEQLLFTPRSLYYLRNMHNIHYRCIEIQLMGLEIEDIESLLPEELNDYLQKMQNMTLKELKLIRYAQCSTNILRLRIIAPPD